MEPIKVSDSNDSDVQGFSESLKGEGSTMTMAQDENVGEAQRNVIRDRR